MKAKFENFFQKKTDNSCTPIPTINRGGIKVSHGGCFDGPKIEITRPHISVDNDKLSDENAKNHTHTIKF